MADAATMQSQIRAFGEAYDYDASYLIWLFEASPGAFQVFTAAQDMSRYREALPLDAHFVARIATMQTEDCGACAQLNLRMAVEAGVDRELLAAVIEDPERLPRPLRDVRDHARAVCAGGVADAEREDRIRAHYGDAAFAELAVVITGSRIYPTLKRALLKSQECTILTLDF